MVAEIDAITTGVGARVPVSVRNLRFNGPVRVVVTHLTPDAPGYGAVLLSLPSRPEVAIDCSVAYGEVTRVPWLRGELERTMQQRIASDFLWPRRVVVPAIREGTLNETVLPAATLDELQRDDPLLRAFTAREPNVRTVTSLGLAPGSYLEGDEKEDEKPAFNVNLNTLNLNFDFTDFGEFNWTHQLQAAGIGVTSAFSDAGEKNDNETTTPWWASVGQGLQAAGSAIGRGLQPAGSAIANATAGVTNATVRFVRPAGSAIANATGLTDATKAVTDSANAFAGGVTDATKAVTDSANAIANYTAVAGSALADATAAGEALVNSTSATLTAAGEALVNVDSNVKNTLSAFEPRMPSRSSRDNATAAAPRNAEGEAVASMAAATLEADAGLLAQGSSRNQSSSLLQRVLLSGKSRPPFAGAFNGRVVSKGTITGEQDVTVPAIPGEPVAKDADEWW